MGQNKKPILSIGMIIKNEIRCLERCLRSLEPLRKAIPCELVIADTGSTDGSRALAQQYADILFDYTWCNDFAAARNAVLERCSGEWWFSIDADEWIEDAAPLVKFFSKENPIRRKYTAIMTCIYNYTDRALTSYGEFFILRIADRRNGALQYSGRIHEMLSYKDGVSLKQFAYPSFVLHHDGYCYVSKEDQEKKLERNMVLLEQTIQEHPDDLRSIGQAVQSARSHDEKLKYTERMEETLFRVKDATAPPQLQVACQICAEGYFSTAYYQKLQDFLVKWEEFGASSILYQVDGMGYGAIGAYYLGDYPLSLTYFEAWHKGLAAVRAKKDLLYQERYFTQFNTTSDSFLQIAYTIYIDLKIRNGQYNDVEKELDYLNARKISWKNITTLCSALMRAKQNVPGSVGFLNRMWDYLQEASSQDPQLRIQKMAIVHTLLRPLYKKNKEQALSTLVQMGKERLPGQIAALLLASSQSEFECAWAEVSDWSEIPVQMYLPIMESRFAFPEQFYESPREKFSNIVIALTKNPKFPFIIADWLGKQGKSVCLSHLTWKLELLTAALQMQDWEKDLSTGDFLCDTYFSLSQQYLSQMYLPDVLNETNILCLPGMLRFAWHCGQASQMLEQGNELGYIQQLHQGLADAPAMKTMVDFLLRRIERRKRENTSPELLELADKVRTILAQYPPDDPSVAALKQSEVYQKVAYLIEGMDAPVFGGIPQ